MLNASASAQSHPRRPPAHLSVNLRHESLSPASGTCSLRAQAAKDEEYRQSSLAWRVSPIRRTSAESNETTGSRTVPAVIWFNQSNKNVGGNMGPRFLDS